MKQVISPLLQISICTVAYLSATSSATLAQVTSDGTVVNTQVNQNGNVAEITGGQTRGSNLFHSFQDFSVGTGNEAFFNNADSINNIFSRVTGGNISNIDGLIRANGSASLFLINPAGIIFGENARLDIGGSFYGSSASSILFEDGEFSAVNNLAQPILTINAPIGLGFRDNPGDIVNRSTVQNSASEVIGLEVDPGNNLTFIASNLNFEGGNLTASGGDIYLGAISESGTVEISENGSLSFVEDISRGDITLSNGSDVDVRGSGGGNIKVDVQNLNLERGELGISSVRAGIRAESTAIEAQAGDITINATGNISLNEGEIANNQSGIGNSGNVFITTNSLSLLNGGLISTITSGQGNAGAVSVTATEDITADGEDSEGFASGIFSTVDRNVIDRTAIGNSGGVTISTTNLNLTAGGRIDASTFAQGNAGAINVTAIGNITADDEASGGLPSGIFSTVDTIVFSPEERDAILQPARGNSGGIIISTNNLNLTAGGGIDASTFAQGNAGAVNVIATGDITADGESLRGATSGITSRVFPPAVGDAGGVTISTNNLNLTNGGRVDASTAGQGNAGAVNVTATGDIIADGERASRPVPSGITSRVNQRGKGNSGGVTVSTNNLNLAAGGNVSASTAGQGNAGAVVVTATGDINADGEGSGGSPSGITSTVGANEEGEGDAGGVTISTTNLNLTAGGSVSATTEGQGNANNVTIEATESITIGGFTEGFRSGISANALNQDGNGGDVFIDTGTLSVANGGTVEATNFDNIGEENPGTGRPGSINIAANTVELTDNARIETATQFAGGESSIINLQVAEDITLEDNSFISAQAFGDADGGNLTIDARFIIASLGSGAGNDLVANAERGTGGNITLNVDQLFGLQERQAIDRNNNFIQNRTNDIDVSGGIAGDLNINATNVDPLQGTVELPSNIVVPEETAQQACDASRVIAAKNSLTITSKGGIPADPGVPLDSFNVLINGETNLTSAIPQPIETSQGKIQLARGIKVNESGEIILTAYRTNNSGDRIPEIKRNCGRV